jgi:LPPG:FO 2-phospho-L-lactate transferase
MGIVAIAGGIGGAKLALGLYRAMPPEDVTFVVNTGDDEVFHGLHISPDLDTVMYTLAGLANQQTGWGITEDTFNAREMLGYYGAETWFGLGDRDLATHIERTRLLAKGFTLTEVTRHLCLKLQVLSSLLPMSDQPVRTIVKTPDQTLSFQQYFVKLQCQPVVRNIIFEGADDASMSTSLKYALDTGRAIVFCPSNPVVSIGPILAIREVRERLESFQGPRVAVSPIVGGQALKGPAAKMLRELGEEVSSLGVARRLSKVCDILVIDAQDANLAPSIRRTGLEPVILNTIMETEEDKVRLAKDILNVIGEKVDNYDA